ncbi:MAG: hypothetical protein KH009_08000 [Clostridiales bacterium]|nr:hypothetical protein [Clostridiales bacterium]
MTFEEMVKSKILPLKLRKDDEVVARGVHIPYALLTFEDDDSSVISYPDTGVFVLFQGSSAFSREKKYEPYIDSPQRTTNREIVFQSRDAAAKFVLGHSAPWEE